jgi:hypothetical protein
MPLARRFGSWAPGHLTYLLVAAQLLGLIAGRSSPELAARLSFDLQAISQGEIWRLFTWLTIPPTMSLIWALFAIYWFYIVGTALEAEWGAFKFLVYWGIGFVATVLVAAATGAPATSESLQLTMFFAFATLWPEYEIRVFMLVPVKVKWLALFAAVFLVWQILSEPGLAMLVPLVSVANYLLFFHDVLRARLRGLYRQAERAGARNRMRAARTAVELPKSRRCAICGASNDDPEVEIRICDCEKCGGVRRDLCLPHVRNH